MTTGEVSFWSESGIGMYFSESPRRWWQAAEKSWDVVGWFGDGKRTGHYCKICDLITFKP